MMKKRRGELGKRGMEKEGNGGKMELKKVEHKKSKEKVGNVE